MPASPAGRAGPPHRAHAPSRAVRGRVRGCVRGCECARRACARACVGGPRGAPCRPSPLSPAPRRFDWRRRVQSPEASNFALLFESVSVTLDLLQFHMNFRINLSVSAPKRRPGQASTGRTRRPRAGRFLRDTAVWPTALKTPGRAGSGGAWGAAGSRGGPGAVTWC